MGRINLSRVIVGGLVAGLVIDICEGVLNGMVLADRWGAVMTSLNRPATPSVKTMIALNVWGFAAGILTVWIYAALRPRFGSGPKTAMIAGLTMWAAAFALATAVPVFLHIYPVNLALTSIGVEIIEMLAAATAGAYFYKEGAAGALTSGAAKA